MFWMIVCPCFQVCAQKKKHKSVPKLTYQLENQISLAGNGSYDQTCIDQEHRKLYISHGTTVQVLDLDSLKLTATLGPFREARSVAVVNEVSRCFITDSKENAVKVFDTRTFEKLETISITGQAPHSILYDPNSNVLFTFNWGSRNSTIVNPVSMLEHGTVDLGGNPEIAFTNANGLVYNTLEDRNQLVLIDSKSKKVFQRFALTECMIPTALAYDALNGIVFIGCRENKALSVLSAASGKQLTTLPIGAGVGTVVYDPETKLIVAACADGTTTIIKQSAPSKYDIVQTLATPVNSPTFSLDGKTGKIYLSSAEMNTATNSPLAGTFKIMVYSRRPENFKTLTKR